MTYEDITSLEELFSGAMQQARAEKAAEAKRPKRIKAPDSALPPDELFSNPANWIKGGGVALVHTETQTLLGNFTEWTHKSVVGARKLVREGSPILISSTEYVEGDWWLGKELEVAPQEEWHTRKAAVIHLVLPQLGVYSPSCPVIVHLSYGGIARVELEAPTQFAQVEGAPVQILHLPAGVNVLPVMSQDCKIALKMEIEK